MKAEQAARDKAAGNVGSAEAPQGQGSEVASSKDTPVKAEGFPNGLSD